VFFEGVALAGGIDIQRFRLVDQLAQVVEMALRGGDFADPDRAPFLDEVFGNVSV
jgi:hypothetical protein